MNVNEPTRPALGSSVSNARSRFSSETQAPSAPTQVEDTHLAELLRSLRSLAADSPERQAKIEGLMRAYATGGLQVDAEATASAIIDDAIIPSSTFR